MSEPVHPVLIRPVGPEEAALRQRWADEICLSWYGATVRERREAQERADALWLELCQWTLRAGEVSPGPRPTEMGKVNP